MNNLHLRDGKIAFRWKRWRNKKRQEVSYCLMVLFSGAVLFGAGGMALAGPTGGQVTSGTGTINQAGTTTTIDQTSSVLNINWQTFSTAPNETVNFVQPGSTSLAINRVVGGVPSYLQGALNANGRVFILNSAGITFAGTSRVNVGALLATTAMSVNGNVGGLANYSAPSGSGGSVINQGSITVSNGGFAILAAPYVQNTGFIKADLGTVALAGTNSFTLDLRGDGLINFVVPPGTAAQIAADGQKVGVDNSGTLQARSGQVIISANVATQVVNAVVNMSGVVDADALSGNSKGGSVLVTSTGDINLGGTITAEGNGTGAGGSIVTKAAGVDNIEAGAHLLAAGGTAGQGGFIEVSGHNVRLDGNIVAGKGGKLLIDPDHVNIDITGTGPSTMAESTIQTKLQAGTAVSIHADHNVTFLATGSTHTLHGGAGDLTVLAGQAGVGSILFHAKNYVIRTGSGDVFMSAGYAGGNIGDAGHRLSVVSGTGTDMPGVTQAGDVVLKAPDGSMWLENVTVLSKNSDQSGGGIHAKFSASAHGTINIAGKVDVEVHATGDGSADTALVHLKAHSIDAAGPVIVLANRIAGSGNSTAEAKAVLSALAATNNGHLTFGNSIDVEANAKGTGDSVHGIKAVASALLSGESVNVDGNAKVIAVANESGDPAFVTAEANLIVHTISSLTGGEVGSIIGNRILNNAQAFNGAVIHFHNGIDVEADAHATLGFASSVIASADVVLDAAHIAVDGKTKVSASATGASANVVHADAKLLAQLGQAAFATDGDVATVNGTANAFSFAATGELHVGANDVTFGNAVIVTAFAQGDPSSGVTATAFAHLAGFKVDVAGKVTVTATADNTGDGRASANALLLVDYADASLQATANNITGVENFLDSHNNVFGGANTHALSGLADTINNVFGHSGDAVRVDLTAHLGGSSVAFHDGLAVTANAQAADGTARANGAGTLAGFDITVNGPASVTASAGSHGGSHRVEAKATLLTDFIGVDATVRFGSVTGTSESFGFTPSGGTVYRVDAHFGGSDSGLLTNQAEGLLSNHAETKFNNGFDVSAVANAQDPNAALALASAHFVTPDLDVSGSADVTANVTATSGGVEIEALSKLTVDNLDFTVKTIGASAFSGGPTLARFLVGGSDVSFQKGFDVEAHATGSNIASAILAEANVTLTAAPSFGFFSGLAAFAPVNNPGNIRIGGPATVKASAHGNSAESVDADATLTAEGGSFSTAIGSNHQLQHFGANSVQFGSVDVEAKANGASVESDIEALASVQLYAHSIVVNGPATVKATASNSGGSPHFVGATAKLTAADGASSMHSSGSVSSNRLKGSSANINFANAIDVEAHANGAALAAGGAASALADVKLAAEDEIYVGGNVTVIASATGHGIASNNFAGRVNAQAGFTAEGSEAHHRSSSAGSYNRFGASTIFLDPALTVTAKASGHFVQNITANAQAVLAADSVRVDGDVNITASANGFSADKIRAEAELTAEGGSSFNSAGTDRNYERDGAEFINFLSDVNVQAQATGNHIDSSIEASANALLVAENILMQGDITVTASANGFDAREIFASANLIAEGGSSSGANGISSYRGHFGASSINFLDEIDVQAKASGHDVSSSIEASAYAKLFGRFIQVDGEATVKATADNSGFSNSSAVGRVKSFAKLVAAEGSFSFVFEHGLSSYHFTIPAISIDFQSEIDVEALTKGGTIDGVASANAFVHLAGFDIAVVDDITVLANATGHGSGNTGDSRGSSVLAKSRLIVDGGSYGAQGSYHNHSYQVYLDASNINIAGAIDVEAKASGGQMRDSISASAYVHLLADPILVSGPITVKATAVNVGTNTQEVDDVRANGVFITGSYVTSYFFNHGDSLERFVDGDDALVTLAGNLDVEARANGGNLGSYAQARSLVILAGNDVTVSGNVDVKASATGHGFSYTTYDNAHRHHTADGVFGEASLFVVGSVGMEFFDSGRFRDVLFIDNASSATLKGKVDVAAKVAGQQISGSVDGSADFAVTAERITLDDRVDVKASANGTSIDGFVEARAHGSLESSSDAGSVNAKGPITVLASAHGNNSNFDSFGRNVEAGASLDVDGRSMQLRTINVTANAAGIHFDNVEAFATADLGDTSGGSPSSGRLTVRGNINVKANATGTDVERVEAFARVELFASTISVSGNVKAIALARGNDVGSVDGSAEIEAHGDNLVFNGTLDALARADVSNTFDGFGADFANAEARVDLIAASSINVFAPGTHGPGITASAFADTQDLAHRASAGAFIEAHAATDGTGNLFIKGNMTAHAVAIGSYTDNRAFASQNLTAQNVTIIGNIRSLAFADGANDLAMATVAIDADLIPDSDTGSEPHHDNNHGVILIIGEAPIASAIAGTAHAFRQAAFSTHQSVNGLNNSHAVADIDIEGSEAIVVTPTTDQQLRLLTLETLIPNPPWASSSLSEIVLTMQGHKCGVLGGAGNPNQRSDACEKRSIHISETDTLP